MIQELQDQLDDLPPPPDFSLSNKPPERSNNLAGSLNSQRSPLASPGTFDLGNQMEANFDDMMAKLMADRAKFKEEENQILNDIEALECGTDPDSNPERSTDG